MRTSIRRVLIAVVVTLPLTAGAQAVHGTIRDRTTAPLPGVVALLLDSASRVVSRQLSNAQGGYRLTAPAPGAYRIQTRRIGYAPSESETLLLGPGQDLTRDFLLSAVQISLDTVRVVGKATCRVDRSTPETFAIWDQVRTALTATSITATDRSMIMTTVTRERSIDAESDRSTLVASRVLSGRIGEPWTSLSADSLHRIGFIKTDGEVATYYAPGLDVLLSDTFLTDHCLRVEMDESRIAIVFEPSRDRSRIPEISGRMTLDRATLALQRMQYNYTNVPALQQKAGGGMEFARLANGAWVITNWNIRMPVIDKMAVSQATTRTRTIGTRTDYYIASFQERSGELALARRDADTLWKHVAGVSVSGVIRDSVTSREIAGAYIAALPSSRATVSDSAGHFRIDGLIPVEYAIEISTPSLDSVGTKHRVRMEVADSTVVALVAPSARQVFGNLCALPKGNVAMLVGKVTRATGAAPNAVVTAEWGDTRSPRTRASVTADGAGSFRFCSIPRDVEVSLRAALANDVSSMRTASIPSDRLMVTVELPLTETRVKTAKLTGRVVTDSTQRPLEGAEVALTDISMTSRTDARGAFSLGEIPAGDHRLFVRRVGYSQLDTTMTFGEGATLNHTIRLDRVVALDSVKVVADRRMNTFDENRNRGLGHFLDRAEMAKKEGQSFASVLAEIPGALIAGGSGGYNWLISKRGGNTMSGAGLTGGDNNDRVHGSHMACHPRVYIDQMQIFTGRVGEPLFNLNSISPDRIEAMEFYAGVAQVPAMYAGTNDACGVLVIWLRRTFDDPEKPEKP